MPCASRPLQLQQMRGVAVLGKHRPSPVATRAAPARQPARLRAPHCLHRPCGALFHRDQRLVACGPPAAAIRCPAAWPSACSPPWHPAACGRHQRGLQQRAEGQDGNALALATDLAFAKGQAFQAALHRHTSTTAARVAHGHGVVLVQTRCSAAGGTRFRRPGRQCSCWECSAKRECRRHRRGWHHRHRPDPARSSANTTGRFCNAPRRGSAGRRRAAKRWSKSPPPA